MDEGTEVADDEPSGASPQEQMEKVVEALRHAVMADLLDRVHSVDPSAFERIVLDVLHKAGYGAVRANLHHVAGSGDGGFDGIIALDRLGPEKVYVQAKRWQSTVGRPEIQAFFGALSGRRARKGVFITTAGFTREALEFAAAASDQLVLVNGRKFAELMIECGIGVKRGVRVRGRKRVLQRSMRTRPARCLRRTPTTPRFGS